ncbi:MAG: hypothetical protein V4509_02780 [Patescibacteria group bacterium]
MKSFTLFLVAICIATFTSCAPYYPGHGYGASMPNYGYPYPMARYNGPLPYRAGYRSSYVNMGLRRTWLSPMRPPLPSPWYRQPFIGMPMNYYGGFGGNNYGGFGGNSYGGFGYGNFGGGNYPPPPVMINNSGGGHPHHHGWHH